MQKFTTRNIEDLCGIKAATLYIWERRYQLCVSEQNNRSHKYYSEEQLKNILLISCLYYAGFKLPALAQMKSNEHERAVWQLKLECNNEDAFKCKLLSSALDFNTQRVNEVLNEIDLEKGFLKVIYPVLQTVRAGAKRKLVLAAIDPFLSLLVEHKIIDKTEKLPPLFAASETVALFGAGGTNDRLSLLFIHYLMRNAGRQTMYLGLNVKWQNLYPAIEKEVVTTVYVYLSEEVCSFEIDDYLEGLCTAFPHKTIIASGAAVHAAQRLFTNLVLLKSDAAIKLFAKEGFTSATRK